MVASLLCQKLLLTQEENAIDKRNRCLDSAVRGINICFDFMITFRRQSGKIRKALFLPIVTKRAVAAVVRETTDTKELKKNGMKNAPSTHHKMKHAFATESTAALLTDIGLRPFYICKKQYIPL